MAKSSDYLKKAYREEGDYVTVKLEGKPVAKQLENELKDRIQALKKADKIPVLQIIRVGANKDDLSYEKGLLKNCKALGIDCRVKEISPSASQRELEKSLETANQDDAVDGILIFSPLPEPFEIEPLKEMIAPQKDVDCMSPTNMGKIFSGQPADMAPSTAKSVLALLDYYEIPLKGANVVIVGASYVVGRPLAMLLLDRFATVTLCHEYTEDVPAHTKEADIVISACGVPHLLKANYFNEEAVVIDVGINFDKNGKIIGDVDYEDAFGKVKALTPAVGGVGASTSMILLSHVVSACEAKE